MNYERPELIEHLAREYVLGTMTGPARRRFATLAQNSRPIAAAVGRWEERMAVMERSPVLVPAPLSAWRAIEQRLFATQRQSGEAGFLETVRRWLTGRALGGVVAGMLVAVVVIQSAPTPLGLEPISETLPASYVGVLSADSDRAAVVVSSRRHGKRLTVKVLTPIAVPQDHQATLWAIPKTGAPWVIGTIASSGQTQIALPAESEKLFSGVSRLAISFEANASQAPTTPSPFMLQGACVKVW